MAILLILIFIVIFSLGSFISFCIFMDAKQLSNNYDLELDDDWNDWDEWISDYEDWGDE